MKFKTFGLSEKMLKAIYRQKWEKPLPIQVKAIPLIMQGRDVIACSRTGSGKTGAYLIPLINKLGSHSQTVGTRVLILVPTRELALQVAGVIKALTFGTDLRHALLIGGHDYEGQFEAMAANPDVVVATPGRLVELISQTDYSLLRLEALVFDEADSLFEPGFRLFIDEILEKVSKTRQTLLFSATIPESIKDFAKAGLRDYAFVRLDSEHTLQPSLRIDVLLLRNEEKLAMVTLLVRQFIAAGEQSIFFVSTRYFVDLLEYLWTNKFNIDGAFLTGHMDIEHRENQLGLFRKGEKRVLVTTDVCARGVDIPEVKNVVSLDFPATPKIFIHRSGRTVRTGKKGSSILLATKNELPYIFSVAQKSDRKVALCPDASIPPEGKVFLGKVASEFLDPFLEEFTSWKRFDPELIKLEQTSLNSMEKFEKTRKPSEKEGTQAAQSFGPIDFHAHFRPKDISHQNLIQAVSNYKPKESVFEMKVLKNLPNASQIAKFIDKAKDLSKDFVPHKPKFVAKPIVANDEDFEVELPEQRSYKDPRLYIRHEEDAEKAKSLVDPDRNTNLLMSEESVFHKIQKKSIWDAKKKKFVNSRVDQYGENVEKVAMKKKAMKESMTKLGKKFKGWKNSSKLKIQKEGTAEDRASALKAKEQFEDRRSQKFRKVTRPSGMAPIARISAIADKKKQISHQKLMNMDKGKRKKIQKAANKRFQDSKGGKSDKFGGKGGKFEGKGGKFEGKGGRPDKFGGKGGKGGKFGGKGSKGGKFGGKGRR